MFILLLRIDAIITNIDHLQLAPRALYYPNKFVSLFNNCNEVLLVHLYTYHTSILNLILNIALIKLYF